MEELKEKPKYEWQKITWLSNLFTPLNRKFHVSVYHDKSLFIFGGDANPQLRPQGSEKTLNELYQLKLNQRQFNWTKITSFKATFFPLIISQLSVIGYEKNLIFYGGVNGKSVLNTVFSFDLENVKWNKHAHKGVVQQGRHRHTASLYFGKFDGENKEGFMIVFGGSSNNLNTELLNDIQIFSIDRSEWINVPTIEGEIPSPRCNHSANIIGNKLYIFGGYDGASCLNDLFCLTIGEDIWNWRKIEIENVNIPIRAFHATTTINDRYLFLHGGHSSFSIPKSAEEAHSDCYIFDSTTSKIYKVNTSENLNNYGHRISYVSGKIYFIGGEWNLENDYHTTSNYRKSGIMENFCFQILNIPILPDSDDLFKANIFTDDLEIPERKENNNNNSNSISISSHKANNNNNDNANQKKNISQDQNWIKVNSKNSNNNNENMTIDERILKTKISSENIQGRSNSNSFSSPTRGTFTGRNNNIAVQDATSSNPSLTSLRSHSSTISKIQSDNSKTPPRNNTRIVNTTLKNNNNSNNNNNNKNVINKNNIIKKKIDTDRDVVDNTTTNDQINIDIKIEKEIICDDKNNDIKNEDIFLIKDNEKKIVNKEIKEERITEKEENVEEKKSQDKPNAKIEEKEIIIEQNVKRETRNDILNNNNNNNLNNNIDNNNNIHLLENENNLKDKIDETSVGIVEESKENNCDNNKNNDVNIKIEEKITSNNNPIIIDQIKIEENKINKCIIEDNNKEIHNNNLTSIVPNNNYETKINKTNNIHNNINNNNINNNININDNKMSATKNDKKDIEIGNRDSKWMGITKATERAPKIQLSRDSSHSPNFAQNFAKSKSVAFNKNTNYRGGNNKNDVTSLGHFTSVNKIDYLKSQIEIAEKELEIDIIIRDKARSDNEMLHQMVHQISFEIIRLREDIELMRSISLNTQITRSREEQEKENKFAAAYSLPFTEVYPFDHLRQLHKVGWIVVNDGKNWREVFCSLSNSPKELKLFYCSSTNKVEDEIDLDGVSYIQTCQPAEDLFIIQLRKYDDSLVREFGVKLAEDLHSWMNALSNVLYNESEKRVLSHKDAIAARRPTIRGKKEAVVIQKIDLEFARRDKKKKGFPKKTNSILNLFSNSKIQKFYSAKFN